MSPAWASWPLFSDKIFSAKVLPILPPIYD
jgi:hypothetical protein